MELLIAVTILAIIVIPLLHLFVTSTKLNVKSRQTLRATTVAQDIMEGLKAYTLEEVITQFEPPAGSSGGSYHYPSDGFYIINSSLIQGGVRNLTKSMPSHVDGDEIYYFGMENVKLQGGEYDVLVTLDASAYGDQSKKKDDTGTPANPTGKHDREFNGKFYAEIGSVAEVSGTSDEAGKATDSSYHQNKKLDDDVLKDVKKQIESNILSAGGEVPETLDELKLESILKKRTMHIVFSDAGSQDAEGNEQCKALITFTYECEYDGTAYTSYGYNGSGNAEVKDIGRAFSSGNFYLFYYPRYSTGHVIDYIEFDIQDASKLLDEDHPLLRQITLVKQIKSDVDTTANVIAPELSEAELRAKESAYQARLTITPANSKLILRTNLGTNMADGTAVNAGNITNNFNPANITQCGITGDNVSDKVTNVIYDVKISVYKTGAAQYFTETGFEDRDEVHKLATITNAQT